MSKVAGYIERKTMLYKTCVEYGDYTMNFVQGCSHGCKFPCYAFLQKKRFGQINDYEDWCKPRLVSNTLDLLDEEIPKLKNKISSVQLCFTTDPFMHGFQEIRNMAILIIKKLNIAGIKCTVLTKGILPKLLADFSRENEYGITLVSLDEKYRKQMEPGASSYCWRYKALKALHDAGCKTWISMEPYPTPNMLKQNLHQILEAISFVDKIIFGRVNYNKNVLLCKEYREFYNRCAAKVISFCQERGIQYHIKNKTITNNII